MCIILKEGWCKKYVLKLQINKIHMHFKENCSEKAELSSPLSQYVAEI